jgi:hypothetical protein
MNIEAVRGELEAIGRYGGWGRRECVVKEWRGHEGGGGLKEISALGHGSPWNKIGETGVNKLI